MVTGGGGETDRKVRNEDAASSGRRGEHSHPLTSNNHAVTESVTQSGESGKSFEYSHSVKATTYSSSVPEQQITAYLSRIQRVGCLIAVDDSTFAIIGYRENARETLGLISPSVPSIDDDKAETLTIDTDLRCRFRPSSIVLLERAFVAQREITLLIPLWIHSKNTRKPFFQTEDPALSMAGAVQSRKLACLMTLGTKERMECRGQAENFWSRGKAVFVVMLKQGLF
ncbi:BnaC08g10540D [Brassica napus]|nr:BnaC08g10540D [Brassica napus]